MAVVAIALMLSPNKIIMSSRHTNKPSSQNKVLVPKYPSKIKHMVGSPRWMEA